MSRASSPSVLDKPSAVPANWREQVTLTVPEAGQVVGICRNTAYLAAAKGDIPTINLAGRIAVPVAALRRKLGEIA
jgi:hypothetical protein